MSVAVTLKQEKTVLTDTFRVVSWITSALPQEMYPLFVMEQGLHPWEEVYDSIATLDDLARYVENPLTRFDDVAVDFSGIGATTGDILIITSAIPEWESSFLARTPGPPSGFRFPLNMHDVPGGSHYVVVDFSAPSWQAFPDARNGLAWTLKDSTGATRGSGTAGYSRACNDATGKFLRRHLTSLFNLAAQAEARAQSIDTGVHSVATAADTTPPPFGGISEHTYP
jgi:hypothetical protein